MAALSPKRTEYKKAVQELHNVTPLAGHLGVVLDQVGPGQVTVHMDVRAEHGQQHGYVHAGIMATLADIACGLAAYSLMAEGETVLSVNMNLSLLRPAKGGCITADARVVSAGRRLYFTEAVLFDENRSVEEPLARAAIVMTSAPRQGSDRDEDSGRRGRSA